MDPAARSGADGRHWLLRAYGFAASATVWGAVLPIEVSRLLLGRTHRAQLQQRLGVVPALQPASQRRLLIHAVSVGEMRAASALVRELAGRLPGHDVVLTTMTAEGLRVAEDICRSAPNVVACAFLPWDRAAAIRSWLRRLQPQAVVVVETEIWPNLFAACDDLDIPLLVASGRIYPRDVWRYALARPFFRRVLEPVAWLGVQSAEEAAAFRRIGAPAARIEVAGNLKYDVVAADRQLPDGWEARLRHGGPIVVAGSTHAPEEDWLLTLLPELRRTVPGTRLVIAPRHVRRTAALQRLAARHGLRIARWSRGASAAMAWDVLLLDEMGWLASLYRFADLAIVGGTFARRGGHNVLEAAARGKAIVVGPHVQHIRRDVEALSRSGGIEWLREPARGRDGLRATLAALLSDAGRRDSLGARAAEHVAGQSGAAHRCADRIARLLAVADPASAGTRGRLR